MNPYPEPGRLKDALKLKFFEFSEFQCVGAFFLEPGLYIVFIQTYRIYKTKTFFYILYKDDLEVRLNISQFYSIISQDKRYKIVLSPYIFAQCSGRHFAYSSNTAYFLFCVKSSNTINYFWRIRRRALKLQPQN
jgi:hypothetical protein